MKKLVTLITAVTIIVTGLASGQSVNKEKPLPEPDRGSVSGRTYSKASASRLADALPTFEKEQGDDYSLNNRQWVSRERVE